MPTKLSQKLLLKSLTIDVITCNLLKTIDTHYHKKFLGVFKEQAFVISHILVVRLSYFLPKRDGRSVLIGCIYPFTVIVSHQLTQLLLLQ